MSRNKHTLLSGSRNIMSKGFAGNKLPACLVKCVHHTGVKCQVNRSSSQSTLLMMRCQPLSSNEKDIVNSCLLLHRGLNNMSPSCPLHISSSPQLQKLALSSGQQGLNSNKSLMWYTLGLPCTSHSNQLTKDHLNMTHDWW